MFPPYSLAPKAASLNPAFSPVLASGGLDMQVALTPASSPDMLVDGETLLNPISRNHVTKFGDALQHRMGFTPSGHGTDVLGMSEGKRLIMVRRYRGIGIWRLRELEKQYDESKPTGWDKVLEMNLQVSPQEDRQHRNETDVGISATDKLDRCFPVKRRQMACSI